MLFKAQPGHTAHTKSGQGQIDHHHPDLAKPKLTDICWNLYTLARSEPVVTQSELLVQSTMKRFVAHLQNNPALNNPARISPEITLVVSLAHADGGGLTQADNSA